MTIFSEISTRIIKEQEQVIGPLAWSEAGKVPGLQIDRTKGEAIVETNDPKSTIDRLVAQYERLFGRASEEVCREAAAPLLAKLSPTEIPSSLRMA
jgi:hypothetical protein